MIQPSSPAKTSLSKQYYFQLLPIELKFTHPEAVHPEVQPTRMHNYKLTIHKGNMTVTLGIQRFDETKTPISVFTGSREPTAKFDKSHMVSFYLPIFNPNRQITFTLRLQGDIHKQRDYEEIGKYEIETNRFVAAYNEQDKKVHQQFAELSQEYSLVFELYVEHTRIELQKLIKDRHPQFYPSSEQNEELSTSSKGKVYSAFGASGGRDAIISPSRYVRKQQGSERKSHVRNGSREEVQSSIIPEPSARKSEDFAKNYLTQKKYDPTRYTKSSIEEDGKYNTRFSSNIQSPSSNYEPVLEVDQTNAQTQTINEKSNKKQQIQISHPNKSSPTQKRQRLPIDQSNSPVQQLSVQKPENFISESASEATKEVTPSAGVPQTPSESRTSEVRSYNYETTTQNESPHECPNEELPQMLPMESMKDTNETRQVVESLPANDYDDTKVVLESPVLDDKRKERQQFVVEHFSSRIGDGLDVYKIESEHPEQAEQPEQPGNQQEDVKGLKQEQFVGGPIQVEAATCPPAQEPMEAPQIHPVSYQEHNRENIQEQQEMPLENIPDLQFKSGSQSFSWDQIEYKININLTQKLIGLIVPQHPQNEQKQVQQDKKTPGDEQSHYEEQSQLPIKQPQDNTQQKVQEQAQQNKKQEFTQEDKQTGQHGQQTPEEPSQDNRRNGQQEQIRHEEKKSNQQPFKIFHQSPNEEDSQRNAEGITESQTMGRTQNKPKEEQDQKQLASSGKSPTDDDIQIYLSADLNNSSKQITQQSSRSTKKKSRPSEQRELEEEQDPQKPTQLKKTDSQTIIGKQEQQAAKRRRQQYGVGSLLVLIFIIVVSYLFVSHSISGKKKYGKTRTVKKIKNEA